jgi:hypothetical protein
VTTIRPIVPAPKRRERSGRRSGPRDPETAGQRRLDAEVDAARAKMGHLGGWYLGSGMWQLPDFRIVRVDGADGATPESFNDRLKRLMREWRGDLSCSSPPAGPAPHRQNGKPGSSPCRPKPTTRLPSQTRRNSRTQTGNHSAQPVDLVPQSGRSGTCSRTPAQEIRSLHGDM